MDGLTTNGVLVMHPRGGFTEESKPGVWREISVCGDVYTLRETRSAQTRGKLVSAAKCIMSYTLDSDVLTHYKEVFNTAFLLKTTFYLVVIWYTQTIRLQASIFWRLWLELQNISDSHGPWAKRLRPRITWMVDMPNIPNNNLELLWMSIKRNQFSPASFWLELEACPEGIIVQMSFFFSFSCVIIIIFLKR